MAKFRIRFAIALVVLTHKCLISDVAAAPGANDRVELFKLSASDGARFRVFGTSVAINGRLALVGSPGAGNGGFSPGSAYLFDVTTGQEVRKLTSSEAAPQHQFGSAVALSGNRAIVGAYGDNTSGSGAVYVFDVTTGQELFKLTVDDAQIGNAVAISGDVAILGSNSDSAYLFSVTTGQQLFKLSASDTVPNDYFGCSVGISGDTAIVGSLHNVAYLFDVRTGEELKKFTDQNPSAHTFGQSVAISGNTAIIGSPIIGSAAATLFDVPTGVTIAKLSAPESPDLFGTSVAIDGNTAIVGGWSHQESLRSAFMFDAITGQQLAKLAPSDDMTLYFQEINFGETVAISGDIAVVGFSQEKAFTGSAYVYSVVPEPTSLLLGCLSASLLSRRISPRPAGNRFVRPVQVK